MDAPRIDEHTRAPGIEAIEQVVARLEHAQQNELPDEFVGLFRPDAIWTTGGGKRLIGRGEISAFTHQVLPGAMKDSTQRYEVEHVLFIRPDVAAVKVRQRPVTLEGRPIEDQPEGSPTYIMAKEDGQGAWSRNRTRSSSTPDRTARVGDGGVDVLDDETRPDGRRHAAVWARTLMIVPLGSSTKKRRTPHGSSLSA
jgi:uncharacterized protein (TIGR02246 family)